MSKPTFQRPPLTLPADRAPAPAVPLPPLLLQFPTPWIVGAYGDIWVAADMERAPSEPSSWRAISPMPRLVMECSLWEDKMLPGLAELIVEAVNTLGAARPPY
jgi:hypothetical protein